MGISHTLSHSSSACEKWTSYSWLRGGNKSLKLTKFDRFLLVSVSVAILVKSAADYINGLNPSIRQVAGLFVLIILFFWVFLLTGRYLWYKLTEGKFAVEAFILNSKKELLLYKHPYHNRFIPPGGRTKGENEFPDQALVRTLRERVGLREDSYKFSEIFHPDLVV
jgi:hypothetical protein